MMLTILIIIGTYEMTVLMICSNDNDYGNYHWYLTVLMIAMIMMMVMSELFSWHQRETDE